MRVVLPIIGFLAASVAVLAVTVFVMVVTASPDHVILEPSASGLAVPARSPSPHPSPTLMLHRP